MPNTGILAPVVAMFLLTFIVWTRLYVVRIAYLRREGIRPENLKTPRDRLREIPDEFNLAAYNLANLSELPVVFYALCVVLFVAGLVDTLYVALAWTYVLLRAAHSLVHCTFNHVMLRFALYFVSSLVLWLMVLRTALQFLAGT